MRYLLMLDTPFWILVCLTLWLYTLSLRRRTRGLNEPMLLLLPRREQARAMGMALNEPMKTSISAPYGHDRRDSSPGSFAITATPTEDRS